MAASTSRAVPTGLGKERMWSITMLVVSLLFTTASADSDQLLKPTKPSVAGSPDVAIVLVEGAQISPKAYLPLATTIQSVAHFPVWIAIPAYTADVPEPSASSGIARALKSLNAAGMPPNTKIVMAGHSLGGAQVQDWTFSNAEQVSLQVLMGAGLLRKYRNGTTSTKYPVPTLGLGGTLDGLFRLTRHAENFEHYCMPTTGTIPQQFPTILFEGMTHMQFASGTPPTLVKDNDLKPEISYTQAYLLTAGAIVNFIAANIFDNSTAATEILSAVKATASIVAPIIDSQQLEATPHLRDPCNSDYSLPASCPTYPRYPSGQQSGTNPIDCTCGTPWSATAQSVAAGSIQFSVKAVDAVHPVSDVTPIHLPHVWNNCSFPNSECVLNVTTVTYPVYSTLDGLDTGFSYISASELRTKLVSRERLLTSAGTTNVNFTATDIVPSICASINEEAWTWALNAASKVASTRFQQKGIPMRFGKDIFLGNAGPIWIENPIEYQLSSDKSIMNVYSPCSHTPINYPVSSAAGFHYCKLLSPARALEWIYLDSLRIKGGL